MIHTAMNEFAKIHCDKNSFNIALGKEKSAKVELDGKFSSENIKIANYNFRNISTNMKLSTQKGFFELDDTAFRFDEVLSGFRIKDDVKIPKFIYDLNKKTGKGNYILVNKGSD